jgi:hypothetical protein
LEAKGQRSVGVDEGPTILKLSAGFLQTTYLVKGKELSLVMFLT